MHVPVFRYMRWAKTRSGTCRYDLTVSSAPPLPLPPIPHPERNRRHPAGDGDPEVEARVAARYGVPPDHVLFVPGSTMANYLLASLAVPPGTPALVEDPAYENLPGLVRLLGAEPVPLPRRPENRYRPDLDHLHDGLRAGARLVFLTDLHNPSGVHLRDDDLEEIRRLAAAHGARVIVDEVYRDFLPGEPATSYRADDPTVLVASSLTKVCGLGSLRAGWLLAPPDFRREAARLLDYLTVIPPGPTAWAAERAFADLDDRLAHARCVARTGLSVVARWVEGRPDVDWVEPDAGVVGFPRLAGHADTTAFCDRLREERDTAVVPGGFFGDPGRVRLAFGVPSDVLGPALRHLSDALEG